MHFLLWKSTKGTSTTPTIFLTQNRRMRRFGVPCVEDWTRGLSFEVVFPPVLDFSMWQCNWNANGWSECDCDKWTRRWCKYLWFNSLCVVSSCHHVPDCPFVFCNSCCLLYQDEWVPVASEETTDRFADVSDAFCVFEYSVRFLVGCWFTVSRCVTVSFDWFVQCWMVET
jgi:hypothetical protein